MAQDLFRRLMFTVIIITLFAFLTIGFANNIFSDNDLSTTDISGDIDLGYDTFAGEVATANSTGTGWITSFLEKDEGESSDGPTLFGMFGTVTNVGGDIVDKITGFSQLATDVLHVPAAVLNTIALLLVLVIIFGVWRIIKVGD